MVERFVPRQLIAAVIGGVLVGGCGTALEQKLGATTTQDVFDYSAAFETYTGKKIVTVSDYVMSGFSYVDHHCQAFFTSLELMAMNGVFAKDTLTLASTAATQILTATDAATKAINIVAAVSGFASNTLNNYNNVYNFAPYSGLLWNQVITAQNSYKTTIVKTTLIDFKPDDSSIAGHAIDASIADFAIGHQIVQGYARLCTIPQIQLFIHTSLATGKPTPSPCAGKTEEQKKNDESCSAAAKVATGDDANGGKKKEGIGSSHHRNHYSQRTKSIGPLNFPVFVAQ